MSKARVAIKEAFSQAIENTPYAQIQVSQLVEQARVARATFYLHYATKDTLLLDYIDDMFDGFYEEISPYLDAISSFEEHLAVRMFRVFESDKRFSRLLVQEDVQALVYRRFKGYLARIFGRLMMSEGYPRSSNIRDMDFVIDYYAGASLQSLVTWVKKDFHPSPEALGELYFALTMQGFSTFFSSNNAG